MNKWRTASQDSMNKWRISVALDSVRKLMTVIKDMTEEELQEAFDLENSGLRRKATLAKLEAALKRKHMEKFNASPK